jgi:uncharacterized Zn finger protein
MRVGGEVQAVCRRCGTVWHVVIALAGGRIANVECGDCGARHRYRPAEGASPKRRPVRTTANRRRAMAEPRVEADLSRPRRPFRPSDTYEVGDRVVHSDFGEGVVQAVRGPSKVEVLFEAGAKTLVQGRRVG